MNNLRTLSKLLVFSPQLKSCYQRTFILSSAATNKDSFKFADLEIELMEPSKLKAKPDPDKLLFGKHFSDHMFEVEWSLEEGWGVPRISPFHDLILHPAAKVLHYAQELFEGMKAYRADDGRILLFRPDLNIKRMLATTERASLPLFDGGEFLKCMKKLISIEKDWVPKKPMCSLYIRPTFIGVESCLGVASAEKCLLYIITGPVGPYFRTGTREPVSLLADPKYVRAWPGGVGDKKMGANYASSMYVQRQAAKYNIQQVLWLYGENHELTEVGAMNVFVFLKNEKGEKELVTPPLDGTILPGVTRRSLLDLAHKWNEFKISERKITMKEVINASKDNRLLEIFGSGTACVVTPVSTIHYMGQSISIPSMTNSDAVNKRLFEELTDIQIGKIPSDWVTSVD